MSSLITSDFWDRYNLLNQSFSDGLDLSRSKLRFDEDTWNKRLGRILSFVLKKENLNQEVRIFLEEYLDEDSDFSDFSTRDAILTKTHLYFAFGDSSDSLYFLYDHASKTYAILDDLREEGRYCFEKHARGIVVNEFTRLVKEFLTNEDKYSNSSLVRGKVYPKLFEYGVGVPDLPEYLVPIVLNNKNIDSRYYKDIAPILEVKKTKLLLLEDSNSIYEKYKDIEVCLPRFTRLVSKFINPDVDIADFQNVYIDYYNRTLYLKSKDTSYVCLNFFKKVGIVFNSTGTFKEKFDFSNIDESIVLGLKAAIQRIGMSVKSAEVELNYPVLDYDLASQTVSAMPSVWGIREDSTLLKQLSQDLLGVS